MRRVSANRLPESSGIPGHPRRRPMRRWTPGSGLLAGFGSAASTTSTAGITGTWWIRVTPSCTRRGTSSRARVGASRGQGLGIHWLPLGCSCFLWEVKHTGEKAAIFCARLRLLPGVLQFLRGGSCALCALGNLAHYSSSPSSLAVTHTVSGCCWRCTGLDFSDLTISTEAFGRSHISVSRFSATRKLGLTVDMSCVTSSFWTNFAHFLR